jgi:hypothetical protein
MGFQMHIVTSIPCVNGESRSPMEQNNRGSQGVRLSGRGGMGVRLRLFPRLFPLRSERGGKMSQTTSMADEILNRRGANTDTTPQGGVQGFSTRIKQGVL